MNPELAYFLKINAGIALFYAFYRLFFYKDTFFHWRRTALLCFIGVSLLYPMLNLQEWVKAHEPMVAMADFYATAMLPEITVEEAVIPAGTNWQNIILTAINTGYLCGVIFLLVRFMVQLAGIIRLRFQCRTAEIQGTRVHILNKSNGPFSFFHWIFVHPDSHTDEEMAEILAHEHTHARQMHSLDVVFSEIMCIFCWFNPFAWLLKREIRNNLEYLADQHVLQNGYDHKKYQYHLLGLANHKAAATLYNSFNVLPLKNRIKMMNKKRTKEIGRTKYLTFLPLAALLMIVSNIEAVARTTKDFARDVIQAVEMRTEPTAEALQPAAAETTVAETPSATPLQEKKVEYKGVIVDETGKSVPNATIGAKISKNSVIQEIDIPKTITDANGKFSFQAVEGITIISAQIQKISASQNISKQDRLNLKIELPSAVAMKKIADETEDVFDVVENMPSFPGNQAAMIKYIADNLRYPAKAEDAGIQGRVIISMIIEKDGSISNPGIMRSVNPDLDAEAIRIISNMPKWSPGTQRGEKVRVRYTVPVMFRLNETKAEEIKNSKLDEVVVVGYASNENTPATPERVLENAEEMPKFPGGVNGLMQYLAKHIKYPTDAQRNRTEGRVILQMIVNKDGRVINPKIIQSVSPSLDNEAIRLVLNMPRWEPGKDKGEPVAVQYTLPISFTLH